MLDEKSEDSPAVYPNFMAKMLGMITLPALLFYPLGAVVGIVFGLVEIRRINRNPELATHKPTVINCIALNAIGLCIFGFMFSLTYAKYEEGQRLGRESIARLTIYTIYDQQQVYRKTNSLPGTLNDLARNEWLDQRYLREEPIDGYVYSISDISEGTYCIHADRAEDKSGYNDYLMCEDGLLRFSRTEAKGTINRGGGELWPFPSMSGEKSMFNPCK